MNGIAAMRFWHLSRPAGLSEDLANHDLAAEICSQEEFHAILTREKARADRNGHGFSLVAIEGLSVRDIPSLAAQLRQRIRTTDEIGLFDHNTLGVFLYNTPALGARQFVNNSKEKTDDSFSIGKYTVYSYPNQWCVF